MSKTQDEKNAGQFYTPTLFVDYVHKMISEQFGENWKDEYVVWDCACGTKNLTRDYKFKDLYCSTLFDSELEMAKKYNTESTSFQFDFLNDPDDKLPTGLIDAFEKDKPLMFFINPPYGQSTGRSGLDKGTVVGSNVWKEMKKDKINGSEFIKQFLYRICKIKENYHLTNAQVCCFTNPSWLLKPRSENFRKPWFKNFKFESGIMFCASEFADCSSQWGITFNIWTSGEPTDKNNFVHTLVERNKDNEIVTIGEKTLYNFDGQDITSTHQYVLNPNKQIPKQKQRVVYCKDTKHMKFGCDEFDLPVGYLGFNMCCAGSDVQQNNICFITSANPSDYNNQLVPVTSSNILESVFIHTIRDIITTNWVNNKDQYNLNVEIPDTFKYDCLVYSLFQNYCMSYRLDSDRLENHFFWMSKDEMQQLANDNSNNDCYNDVRTDTDRYVYKLIEEHYNELSDEAKSTLETGRELVRKSFKYRQMFHDEEPKYQINNWDAGWYQIKALLKTYLPDDLKEFRSVYKKFADKLRPQVYELGLLRS